MSHVLSPGEIPFQMREPSQPEPYRDNLNVHMICKDCQIDPPELFENHATGDIMCDNCGLVLSERNIDFSSEWRNFSNDESAGDDPSRVGDGPNELLNGDQLSTGIAFGDGNIRTKDLHRAQGKATLDKSNKQLLAAYKHIGALCDGWQLPASVSDSCKHIYKEASTAPSFKGKSQDAIIAGCIFVACRRHGFQRSFREVMELTRVSKKEIGRIFKLLEALLKHDEKERGGATQFGAGGVVLGTNTTAAENQPKPADLCARHCSALGMDTKATNVATLLAEKVQITGGLAGRSPLSIVGACIFIAGHMMNQPHTAKEIGTQVFVSDSTIRQAYKIMYLHQKEYLDNEILDKGADPSKLPKPSP